jgi:hypothetical protein
MLTENVYHLAAFDEGMMCTYDKGGELIQVRKLTPEENQMSINSMRVLRNAQNM